MKLLYLSMVLTALFVVTAVTILKDDPKPISIREVITGEVR